MVFVAWQIIGLNLQEKRIYLSHISNQTSVKYVISQGLVLGPLLFLIYINDVNLTIKFWKVHHFTNDTNVAHFSKSVSKLNKDINLDMKNLTDRVNANKI